MLAWSTAGNDQLVSGLMDVYASGKELEQLLVFLKKTNTSPLENRLIRRFPYSEDDIREVIAGKLLVAGNFQQGLAELKKISEAHWHLDSADLAIIKRRSEEYVPLPRENFEENDPRFSIIWSWVFPEATGYAVFKYNFTDPQKRLKNPVHEYIAWNFTEDALSEAKHTLRISKPAFVEKIADLEQKAAAASGETAAQHYFELANALYHAQPRLLYNARLWNEGHLLANAGSRNAFLERTIPGMYPLNLKNFATEFYNRKADFTRKYGSSLLASQYYQKAASLSKDSKLIAKATQCAGLTAEKYRKDEWFYWPEMMLPGAKKSLQPPEKSTNQSQSLQRRYGDKTLNKKLAMSKLIKSITRNYLLILFSLLGLESVQAYPYDRNIYLFNELLPGSYHAWKETPNENCTEIRTEHIPEWQSYFGQQIREYPEEFAVTELVYAITGYEIAKLAKAIKKQGKNPLPENAIARHIVATRDEVTVNYLMIAWQIRDYINSERNYHRFINEAHQLIDTCIARSKSNIPAFFRQRYALQAILLSDHIKQSQSVAHLFLTLMTPGMPKEYAWYRALLCKAQVVSADSALMALAEVYLNCPPLRCVAGRAIREEKPNLEKTIAAMPAPDTKVALFFLLKKDHSFLFYNYDGKGDLLPERSETLLSEIFRLEKATGTTGASEVALIQYLREIEQRVFLPHLQIDVPFDPATSKSGAAVKSEPPESSFFERLWQEITSFFKSLFGINKEVIRETAFISKTLGFESNYPVFRDLRDAKIIDSVEQTALAMAPESAYPALCYAAAAYLEIMKKDFDGAIKNLDKAKETLKATPLPMASLVQYLDLFCTVMEATVMTPQVEAQFVGKIENPYSIYDRRDYYWERLLLWSELGRRYLRTGDLTKAMPGAISG